MRFSINAVQIGVYNNKGSFPHCIEKYSMPELIKKPASDEPAGILSII